MRGKVQQGFRRFKHVRITPAYAGKRSSPMFASFPKRDHPRLCGEKLLRENGSVYEIGSPPPMRGKVQTSLFVNLRWGITPAYAGKSLH